MGSMRDRNDQKNYSGDRPASIWSSGQASICLRRKEITQETGLDTLRCANGPRLACHLCATVENELQFLRPS